MVMLGQTLRYYIGQGFQHPIFGDRPLIYIITPRRLAFASFGVLPQSHSFKTVCTPQLFRAMRQRSVSRGSPSSGHSLSFQVVLDSVSAPETQSLSQGMGVDVFSSHVESQPNAD
jgi:hypothetical protein